MDALQLARWNRFAAKGGIGRCTAVTDYVAQSSEDLMFLKGDEIVVLMQIQEGEDVYLGFCEDIIGRFRGKDVQFHGKLKRPIMTRRSSKPPSPSARTSSLPSTDDEEALNPSSTTPSEPSVATPPKALGRTPRRSLGSDSGRSTDSHFSSSSLHSSPRILLHNSPPPSPPVVSPLNIVKKSPTSSPLHQTSFVVTHDQSKNTHHSIPPHSIPNNNHSQPDTDDGAVGIGLSFLQSLDQEDSDDDHDHSYGERDSFQHDDESTVEGLLYAEPVESERHITDPPPPSQENPKPPPPPQPVTFPSRSSSPLSPTSPRSFASLSPPSNQQHFSVSSRRPSVQSSSSWEIAGDIYDDYRYSRASISMNSGSTSRARLSSIGSRVSASSKASHRDAWDGNIHEHPPPPIPEPRPSIDCIVISTSGGESTKIPPTTNGDKPLRQSTESKKSSETKTSSRKSSESQVSESTSMMSSSSSSRRKSRQELLFPQPPTNVLNIHHHELLHLDQATRESILSRTSDVSATGGRTSRRVLDPNDFRLSVDSEVSIYSRLSVVEQEEQLGESVVQVEDPSSPPPPSPPPPSSSSQEKKNDKFLRPAPLQLQHNNRHSPLLHTNWVSPMSSPSERTSTSISLSTTASPTNTSFMPNAFLSLHSGVITLTDLQQQSGGMASALRQRVEGDRVEVDGNEEEGTRKEDTIDGDDDGDDDVEESVVNQETILDTSEDVIVLSPTEDVKSRTPSPTSQLVELERRDLFNNNSLNSPMVPSRPPEIQVQGVSVSVNVNPSQSTSSPTSPTSPPSPVLNHLRPIARPTLAELREGGGTPIPGTNQRRSLFLPHPNAPKPPPPSLATPGPMFISAQQSQANPHHTTSSQSSPTKRALLEVMEQALNAPRPAALRPRMMMKGPTIYGQVEEDLNIASGPVPITFSVDPPPPSITTTTASQTMPRHIGGSQSMSTSPFHPTRTQSPAPTPSSPLSSSSSATFGGGIVTPLPRSPTSSPVPIFLDTMVTDGDEHGSSPGGNGNNSTPTGSNGVALPRANFFPRTPGARPRSRSFSAFNSHTTLVEVAVPLSREENLNRSGTPTFSDLRSSLRLRSNSPRSSLRSSVSQGQIGSGPALKASLLRPSPLNTTGGGLSSSSSSSSLTVVNNTIPKSPSSPLAQSFLPPPSPSTPKASMSSSPLANNFSVKGLQLPPPSSPSSATAKSLAASSPLASNFSVKGLQIPPQTSSQQQAPQVRQITSRSTLNDALLSSRPSLTGSPPPSSSSTMTTFSKLQSNNQTPVKDHETGDEVSNHSQSDTTHSTTTTAPTATSTPIHHHRQSSIRTKLSLPNLRRNRSKNDDSTPASPMVEHFHHHDVNGTVQVQDLDFELVRPAAQFQQQQQQQARLSQDSGVGMGGRVHANSMDRQRSLTLGQQHRAGSPVGSQNGPKSPTVTGDGFGATLWSRPSLSSPPVVVVTRPHVADHQETINMEAHRQRENKWMSLMNSVPPSQSRKSKKVKKLIHEGVPSSVRYLVWSHLTDGKGKVVPGVYSQLGNRERIPAADAIEEDIKRCFQEQVHLQGKRGPVLALLQAYLTMVPDIRYTMGLTLISGQLLLHAPEEAAFWIFVSILDTHIRPYFSTNPTQMEVDSTLFSRVVENNDAQLAKKLYVDMGIEPSEICVPWFTTLFVGTLPPDYVNRLWDLFLFEGVPFLLRVGYAVMICCRRQVLEATSSDVVLNCLHHPSHSWLPPTPDGFISLAHSVKMKDDDIRKTRIKMEAQVKRQTQAQNPRHLPITASISLPRP